MAAYRKRLRLKFSCGMASRRGPPVQILMVLTEGTDVARLPVGNQDRAVLVDVGHGTIRNPLMGQVAEGTVRGLHERQPLSVAGVGEAKEYLTTVSVMP